MTTAAGGRSVLTQVEGGVASVTLNRPEVINALNVAMVHTITDALLGWISDERVACVVLRGRGRGFCAGGDLQPGDVDSDVFLRAEYALDALIAEYPKPVIALMHGLVLGGGVGLSGHAAVRVVTDSTRLGMPETRIGICPDVGGSRLLGRAPGAVGTMKAMSSATMSASEAIAFGFADVLVADTDLDAIVDALRARTGDDPLAIIRESGLVRDPDPVAPPSWVEEAFSHGDAVQIVHRLEDGPPDAQEMAARIREMAPMAVAVAVPLVRRAATLTLRETLQLEYAVMSVLAARPDVAEGIRARLVDRDTPRWRPARIEDVDPAEVADVLDAQRPPLDFYTIPLPKETT